MVQIYVLWFLGVTFGITALVELAYAIYKLRFGKGPIKKNIVLAIIFGVACIGCTSTAILTVVEKVITTDVNMTSVGEAIGEKTGNLSGHVYKNFKEEWKNTTKDVESIEAPVKSEIPAKVEEPAPAAEPAPAEAAAPAEAPAEEAKTTP